MAGLTDEESLEDQKKGTVVYQEQKCFDGEWSIINVYDSQEAKRVTFEVYGCDTADIRRVQYNYIEFDAFFRFNAELMNPNRREGRYHWIAERLELKADGAGGRQLALASEQTPQLPELPMYEKRKIPTGRMNYQERQRLRESMDQLDIKRNEAITKKRTVAKAKFLVKIEEMQAEYQERLKARTEKIAKEREERWIQKEGERKQELEAILEIEARNEVRNSNVDIKVENTDERDRLEIKGMHERYKAAEAIRQAEIKEARDARSLKNSARAKEEKETKQLLEEKAAAREEAWRQRELRVQKKRDLWLAELKQEAESNKRKDALTAEKKMTFIKDLHVERQKVFTEQNEKSRRRAKEIEECNLITQEEQAPPPSAQPVPVEEEAPESETKGSKEPAGKPAAKGKKAAKEKAKKPPKEEKKADGAIIDGVEGRMRAEMQRQRELNALETIRQSKFLKKVKARIQKEAENAQRLRNQKRQGEEKERAAKDQRKVIIQTSREEEKKELERKKNDLERRENLRNENIQRKMMARLNTADCGKDLEPPKPKQEASPFGMQEASEEAQVAPDVALEPPKTSEVAAEEHQEAAEEAPELEAPEL